MQEIIKWLRTLESLASDVYFKASEYFKHDQEFSRFLNRAAEDEAWHYHVMVSAAEHFRELHPPTPSIAIGKATEQRIEAVFHEINKKLADKTLTKEELLEALVKTEFSEWNDIFLYVVNTLQVNFREFSYAAMGIQNHKRVFEYFYEKSFEHAHKINELKQRPAIWNEKILIVEDNEPIADLLNAILNVEGDIDIVDNGLKGLKKVEKNYYKLIISDVDMPFMNGLEFYEHASKIYPNINERFLFFTGSPSTEIKTFFKKNHIEFLTKPSDIDVIQEKALSILLRNSKAPMKNKSA